MLCILLTDHHVSLNSVMNTSAVLFRSSTDSRNNDDTAEECLSCAVVMTELTACVFVRLCDWLVKCLLMFVFREMEHEVPVRSSVPLSSGSEMNSSAGRPKKRRARRPRTANGRDHDTDYASSGDELDDDDFSRWAQQRNPARSL